jgi:hypothetical protein
MKNIVILLLISLITACGKTVNYNNPFFQQQRNKNTTQKNTQKHQHSMYRGNNSINTMNTHSNMNRYNYNDRYAIENKQRENDQQIKEQIKNYNNNHSGELKYQINNYDEILTNTLNREKIPSELALRQNRRQNNAKKNIINGYKQQDEIYKKSSAIKSPEKTNELKSRNELNNSKIENDLKIQDKQNLSNKLETSNEQKKQQNTSKQINALNDKKSYKIQCGVFLSKESALALANKLKKNGFNDVKIANKNGSNVVLIGNFETKKSGEPIREKLKKLNIVKGEFWVFE